MEAQLEKELSIPMEATLILPVRNDNDATPEPCLCSTTSNAQIPLSSQTSLHSSTKFLLIGRQAATADLRIDHKSISRKHAVLYFEGRLESIDNGQDNTNNDGMTQSRKRRRFELILKDLGGKHGCHVNGTRVTKGSTQFLKDGDCVQFGNVREQMFNVLLPGHPYLMDVKEDERSQTSQQQEEESNEEIERNDEVIDAAPVPYGLTGRAAREAEIAAMMATLDQQPTFKKHILPENENNGTRHQSSNSTTLTKSPPSFPSIVKKLKLPVTSSLILPAPSNPQASSSSSTQQLLTLLTLDPAGSRLLTGATNGTIYFYDFGGMDLNGKPFKMLTVEAGQGIVQVRYSNTGDRMIAGTTSSTPSLLDREGRLIVEFTKGDMYVTDMAHTDGHISAITGVDFHPLKREWVATSSLDGSVRLWDVDRNKRKFDKLCCDKSKVYRIKNSMGKRVGVTAVSFDPSGRFMACGTACGSIQIWKTDRVGTRPDRAVYDAHGENIAVHSLKFNFDGKRLASRCMEGDSVRVWDARRLSRSSLPMVECLNLLSLYEYSNCAFSPNGQVLCAGTSVKPLSKGMGDKSEQRKEHGKVNFYRVDGDGHDKQQPIWEMDIAMQNSVVNVFWHAKLNQIFLGISDGSVRILYDTKLSKKGALLCVAKGMRKVDDLSLLLESRAPTGSAGVSGDIITPNALPLFRSEAENKKRKRDMGEEEDYRRPEPPATGIKVGEGTSAGLNFQQHVLDSRIKNRNIAGKDPRDDLFKYTVGKNYTREEHKPILAEKTVEEEEEEENE